MIFGRGDRNEINWYLQAVDEIHDGMESLMTMADYNSAIKIAMVRLEEEFGYILTRTGHSTARYSTSSSSISDDSVSYELVEDDYLDYDIIPSEEEINDLQSLAERMDFVQCVEVYGRVRKGTVYLCFQRLGIEKLSIQAVWRLVWDVLEVKIKQWIRAAKFCVQIFFPKEKQLCDQIFQSHGTLVVDFCFIEIVRDVMVQLFDFVEVISSSLRSPERFKFLDLHEALLDLMPELNNLFQSKSTEPIEIEVVESPFRIRAVEILLRLADAVRRSLLQLENDLCHESSANLIPDETIHSLTRYVMDYITRISDYKQSLTSLIVSKPSTDLKYSDDDKTTIDMEFIEVEGQTPLALHLIWIIEILVCKLNVKSENYEDAHLFMMNNVHYIAQRIRDCPKLRMIIGDDFANKLIGKVHLTWMVRAVDSNRMGRVTRVLLKMQNLFHTIVFLGLYALQSRLMDSD
ncbi:exocyst complex component EXO70B1-like [Cornus florida]|uniref:exocyst complex component EXO70B1-like n=1 Tax=Cornus florida TaxID=4283 RepID=UPI0028A1B01F|nr:exocyst complex component EXO70B1-like [Cornus florida]